MSNKNKKMVSLPKPTLESLKGLTSFVGLLAVVLVFSLTTNGKFATVNNIRLILTQSVIIMVGTMGTQFVMAHGNLDFSQGGEMAIAGIVGWYCAQIHPLLMIPGCILTAMIISYVVSLIHNKIKVPSFIVGMCIMFMGKGLAGSICGTRAMPTPSMYSSWDNTWFYLIVAGITIIIAFILLEYTNVGKYNKAIGSNDKTADLSGIPVDKFKSIGFVLSGAAVGIATVITMVRTGGLVAQTGSSYETNILLALVLGGIPLNGGSSVRIYNGIIGALILYILSNGMLLWGVSADLIAVVKSVVFLIVVYFSYKREPGQIVG